MKKAVLTILSFCCIFVMSGCGNSQTDSEINSDSTAQATTAEQTESEETTADNSDIISESESEEESSSTGDETLVVFFSAKITNSLPYQS